MNNFKKYLESVQLKKGIITESESPLTNEQIKLTHEEVKKYFSKHKKIWSLRNCVFFDSLKDLMLKLDELKKPFTDQTDNSEEQYSRLLPGMQLQGETGNSGKDGGSTIEFIFIVKKRNMGVVVYHCVKLIYIVPIDENKEININNLMILSIPEGELSSASGDFYSIENISFGNDTIENKLKKIKNKIIEKQKNAIIKTRRDKRVNDIHRPEFQK